MMSPSSAAAPSHAYIHGVSGGKSNIPSRIVLDRHAPCRTEDYVQFMEVRQATRSDLLEIAGIAHVSLAVACEGLLQPATINAALDKDFSPSSLSHRMAKGRLIVAIEPRQGILGFASVGVDADRVSVSIHAAAERTGRRREWVGQVIEAVRSRFPGRPVFSDVLLGNLAGERSCEVAGFVPGEVIQRVVNGEPVVERRWWCPLPE